MNGNAGTSSRSNAAIHSAVVFPARLEFLSSKYSATFSRRAATVANLGSVARSGRPIASKKPRTCRSVLAETQMWPSRVRTGLAFGSRSRVSPASPRAGSNAFWPRCSCSTKLATFSNIGTSTDCPSPVRSRARSASRIICTAMRETRWSARTMGTNCGSPVWRSKQAAIPPPPWMIES